MESLDNRRGSKRIHCTHRLQDFSKFEPFIVFQFFTTGCAPKGASRHFVESIIQAIKFFTFPFFESPKTHHVSGFDWQNSRVFPPEALPMFNFNFSFFVCVFVSAKHSVLHLTRAVYSLQYEWTNSIRFEFYVAAFT